MINTSYCDQDFREVDQRLKEVDTIEIFRLSYIFNKAQKQKRRREKIAGLSWNSFK
jgi:peroxiredoxin